MCLTVSAVGMTTLLVQVWSFHSSRFNCLTYGKKKGRKEEGIKNKEAKKGRKSQKEKKYLKNKEPPAGFEPAKPVLLVFLAAAG